MIWSRIGRLLLTYRVGFLSALLILTIFMGYEASQVQMSYEFARALPNDNPKFLDYQAFRKKFGEDGNLLVIGIREPALFRAKVFNAYLELNEELEKVPGVREVLSVPFAVNLVKKDSTHMIAPRLFGKGPLTQDAIDSARTVFYTLPFYRGLLYNPDSASYLIAVHIDRDILNSAKRIATVEAITKAGDRFGREQGIEMHYSGLPMIRTNLATKEAKEMKWFLFSSIMLSAIFLLIFFRSFGSMFLSLAVVLIGVVWSLGTMHLLSYKITLISVLIPPLIVVIGIPNCIYFLNKYHTSYLEQGDKREALLNMIGRMGIVTLFCNLSAAIGFGVFALTSSAILGEFGLVAGINILLLFLISFILLPGVLSFLPEPKPRHTRYLENRWLSGILENVEQVTLRHRRTVYGVTLLVLILAGFGLRRIRSEAFIVDDLPQTDPIYADLHFFEQNFKGVMPLEILIDSKRKRGLTGATALPTFEKIEELSNYIAAQPQMAKPLSVVEGLKFLRQAYYHGDSSEYALPNGFDLVFLAPYLTNRPSEKGSQTEVSKLLSSFIDSNRQEARISVNIADIGTRALPSILDGVQRKSDSLFDSSKYRIVITGSSVTFLTASEFIISGLKQSIVWAFLLIACCMLYLFRSWRILACSLIPNMIPLIITAGVMGWVGVPLKPSTVLVFSIALGIAVDITIRFLVNYKQASRDQPGDTHRLVVQTIHSTGISIIYTSLVLIAGFVIFCFSDFGGTKALGWLTSLTLILATVTNLLFLPSLLLSLYKKPGPNPKS